MHTLLELLTTYDKVYRDNAVAHQAGKQLVLRPAFAESGKHFNHIQTILSAFVATDRRGNERGVNVSKQSCGMSNGGFSRAQTVNRLMLPGSLGCFNQTLSMHQYIKL